MVEVSPENMGAATGSSVVHPSGCPAPRGVPSSGAEGGLRGAATKRASAKSVIAAAMNYAANQQEPMKPAVSAEQQQQQPQPQPQPPRVPTAEKPPRGAPPGYGGSNTRANIVSAFGQGVSMAEHTGFDGSGGGVQVSLPIDLTSQSSMVHRMMDREKNDVDPRDVHKLLPETMMASDSLDLHSELIQGKINQVIHDIMDAQVVQDIDIPTAARGRRPAMLEDDAHHYADAQVSQLTRLMPSVELGSVDLGIGYHGAGSPENLSPAPAVQSKRGSMRLSPTPPHLPPRPRSVQGLRSTYSAPSPVLGVSTAAAPVTGYPAAPALGIAHPVNTGRMSPIVPNRAASPLLTGRSTVPAPSRHVPDAAVQLPSGQYALVNQNAPVVTVGAIPVQYMPYSQSSLGKYGNLDGRSSSRLSCRSPISEPVLGSPTGDEQPPAVFSVAPDLRGAMTPIPCQKALEEAGMDFLNPGLDPNLGEDGKGKGTRKFRSLEAALAWCHVQHSQKHVPVVPKDDVKKLVEFQLKNGKPIRAPWYRPTRGDENEEDSENSPMAQEEGSDVDSTPPPSEKEVVAIVADDPYDVTEVESWFPQNEADYQRLPNPQGHVLRPERPRCESAPLVRAWKQPPRQPDSNRRTASQSGNVKPLGTGFFCPPGFEFPAASPTAH